MVMHAHKTLSIQNTNVPTFSAIRRIFTSPINIVMVVLLQLFVPSLSMAHAPNQSYIYLTFEEEKVTGRVEMTAKDLNLALGLGLRENKTNQLEDFEVHKEVLESYVKNHLSFAADGKKLDFVFGPLEQYRVTFAQYAHVTFELAGTTKPNPVLDVENSLFLEEIPGHGSLLVVENSWTNGVLRNSALASLTFIDGNTSQTLDLSSGSLLRGLIGIIEQGIYHIWIGIDHILFLLALLLPSVMTRKGDKWVGAETVRAPLMRILGVVTAFTIAHSITLSLAAFEILTVSSRLAESLIAISIGIAALHMLWPRINSHAYWVVLLFGLFHGFGFASVLGELPIPDRYVPWSLFGFNVGVEIGQLIIVLVVAPVLLFMRHMDIYKNVVLRLGAVGLISISLYWFIERAFDIDFTIGTQLKSLFLG